MTARVTLALGYDVVIAPSLDGLGQELARLGAPGRAVVVTDENVARLHLDRAIRAMPGWQTRTIVVPAGEERKTPATWLEVVEGIVAAGADRATPVLALGGGVVGDLAGFAAASVLRGLPFVQVPTTLLAMVDASVGGKTGVNLPAGKNLLGAFHQPRLVWAAADTLRTLPGEEFRCGLGEVVKHAVIDGEGAMSAVEGGADGLRDREEAAIAAVVEHSVRLKARIVEEDPFERGRRAVLNLGHTLGHAVEAVAGYGAIPHGEAVAIGLVGEARWTGGLPGADSELADRVAGLYARLGVATRAPRLDREALVRAVGFDKKRSRAMVTLAAPFGVGDVRLHALPLASVPDLVAALYPDA